MPDAQPSGDSLPGWRARLRGYLCRLPLTAAAVMPLLNDAM